MKTNMKKNVPVREVLDALLRGESLVQIGQRYGCSRQNIDQILYKYATDEELRQVSAVRAEIHLAQAKERSGQYAEWRKGVLAAQGPCCVCGGPARRLTSGRWPGGPNKTCSRECALLWKRNRNALSKGYRLRHRLYIARYYLTLPATDATWSRREWAKKVIALNGGYIDSQWSRDRRRYGEEDFKLVDPSAPLEEPPEEPLEERPLTN